MFYIILILLVNDLKNSWKMLYIILTKKMWQRFTCNKFYSNDFFPSNKHEIYFPFKQSNIIALYCISFQIQTLK